MVSVEDDGPVFHIFYVFAFAAQVHVMVVRNVASGLEFIDVFVLVAQVHVMVFEK